MKAFYCCLFLLYSCSCCLAQAKAVNPYPFTLPDQNSGSFAIVADVQDPSLYPKYFQLFQKYNYEGNGYCWEGMIRQILENKEPELLKQINFDPEAGAFYAYAKSRADRQRFIQLVSPVFADLKALEAFIKSADRSRIDD